MVIDLKRKFAAFDVDGTIHRSSLFLKVVDVLIERGVFSPLIRNMYITEQQRWESRQSEYYGYIMAVVKAFERYIVGVPIEVFREATLEVDRRHQDQLYCYTRDLLPKLKADGYYLVAISQSPKMVLEPFCKRLGFDKVYGRMYTVDGANRFTGGVENLELIRDKVKIIQRVVEKENLTLEGSVACGDTEGDISMLSAVERPICFNPSMELFIHAAAHDWQVVFERKDIDADFNFKEGTLTFTQARQSGSSAHLGKRIVKRIMPSE